MTSEALLEVLSAAGSTGTPAGVSYYTNPCARLVQLNAENALERAEKGLPPPPSEFEPQVGTVFHKLMELYYTAGLNEVALPIDDLADFGKDPVQEALRLFTAYKTFYPADEWDVVSAERYFPANEDEGWEIGRHVGISPFTGRIDLVVRLTEAHAAKLKERSGLDLNPGLYLVDHKTTGQLDRNASMKWELSIQFTAYQMASQVIWPEDELQGMIVNQPVRHKDLLRKTHAGFPHSFPRFFVPPPSETRAQAVRNYLREKQVYLATGKTNIDACLRFRPCAHYMTGRCNQL